MSDVKEYIQQSELGTYAKTFPALSVPTLGSDAEGYMKNIAEAAIEQIKFLNTFAQIPVEVLYENVGQRHKASNMLALSILRKKSQDSSTSRGGLDMIDIPDDLVAGDYSNAFLPVKADKTTKPSLLKGLLALLDIIGIVLPETRALTVAMNLVEEWLLDTGILREVGMSIVDNLIQGVVSLVVQKILGKDTIVIGDGSAALVPHIQSIAQALTAANQKEQAIALVDAFGANGALATQMQAIKTQLADCCPKEALEKMVKALYVEEERVISGDMTQLVEVGLTQKIAEIYTAFRDEIVMVEGEPETDGEDPPKIPWTQELISKLKDWSYQTETLEIGGIRLALRANIIEQA